MACHLQLQLNEFCLNISCHGLVIHVAYHNYGLRHHSFTISDHQTLAAGGGATTPGPGGAFQLRDQGAAVPGPHQGAHLQPQGRHCAASRLPHARADGLGQCLVTSVLPGTQNAALDASQFAC